MTIEPLFCPVCAANIRHGQEICDYCGVSLTGVPKSDEKKLLEVKSPVEGGTRIEIKEEEERADNAGDEGNDDDDDEEEEEENKNDAMNAVDYPSYYSRSITTSTRQYHHPLDHHHHNGLLPVRNKKMAGFIMVFLLFIPLSMYMFFFSRSFLAISPVEMVPVRIIDGSGNDIDTSNFTYNLYTTTNPSDHLAYAYVGNGTNPELLSFDDISIQITAGIHLIIEISCPGYVTIFSELHPDTENLIIMPKE